MDTSQRQNYSFEDNLQQSKNQNNIQYKCIPIKDIPSVQTMIQNRLYTKMKCLYPVSENDLKKYDYKYKYIPEVNTEMNIELKHENKDDIYTENSITLFKDDGSGKRLKLMNCTGTDDKSQLLCLPEPKNFSSIGTHSSTARDSTNHSIEHIVINSSETNLLQDILTEIKYNRKMLENIQALMQNKNISGNMHCMDWEKKEPQTLREKFRSTFPYIPANSVEDMFKLEHELSNEESRYLMVKRLRQCGGKNISETTAMLLRTVMTDQCATFYNHEGKNNKKLSFRELKIHEVLIDVTLFSHGDETEHLILQKIKNWLRLASTRLGYKLGGQYRRVQNSLNEEYSF